MQLIVKFSLILILSSSLNTFAQEPGAKRLPAKKAASGDSSQVITIHVRKADIPDSTFEWTRGARFGCNIAPFVYAFMQKERKGFEFSLDTRLTPRLYPIFELGFENNQYSKDFMTYHSNGGFGRIGVDYNLRSSDPKSRDMFFIGGRYGFFAMQHRTDNYQITDPLWGSPVAGSLSSSNSYGHWLEINAGVRVQIFNNFFLGYALRSKFLITSKYGLNYPQYMPGFGNGANKVNFGFTYSLFYEIPLMKIHSKSKLKKVEEEDEPEETPKNQIQDSQMQYNNNR